MLGALVDVHLRNLRRNCADQLGRAGACADHGNALAGYIQIGRPSGGVDNRPVEIMEAGDFRPFKAVNRAVSVDHGVDHEVFGRAIGIAYGNGPQAGLVIIDQRFDLGVEAHLVTQFVLVGHAQQVALHIGTLRVVVRPVGPDFPAEAIEVAGGVDAHAGVAVFVPGAANVSVLFDYDIVIACLAQLGRCFHAGKARADHQHLEIGGRGGAISDLGPVNPRAEAALVEHDVNELIFHCFANRS